MGRPGKKTLKYSYTDFKRDVDIIENEVKQRQWNLEYVYGPPRGGCLLAVFLSHRLNLTYLSTLAKKHIPEKTLIVDDVSDTGKTFKNIKNINKYKTAAIFVKSGTIYYPHIYVKTISKKFWIDYFWEKEYDKN